MERRGTIVTPSAAASAVDEQAVAVARIAFADWLREAREARGISLEEVARVTKIQIRTLERLEDARFDELPADVFVRGFLRNYARVVGLDADEALTRYDGCGTNPGPAATFSAPRNGAGVKARAVAEMFAGSSEKKPVPVQPRVLRAVATPPAGTELAAGSLAEIPIPVEPKIEVVEVAPVVEAAAEVVEEPAQPKKRGKGRRGGKGRSRSSKKKIDLQEPAVDDFEITVTSHDEPVAPGPVLVVPPPAFRGRVSSRGPVVTPIPSLVIDDEDPESAERMREARDEHDKPEHRSFLPKALLDSDRGRQGGLTLAVIILLIVATLTLSYLMRRPSAGEGAGVTLNNASDVHATLS